MNSLVFLKRRLGNDLTRPVGIGIGIIGCAIIISGVTSAAILSIASIQIFFGLLYGFGKEMTEVGIELRFIKQYYQLFFLKIGNMCSYPDFHYILVRDFHTKIGYSTMKDDSEYYEISVITRNSQKIVLALYQKKIRVNKVVNELSNKLSLPTKDLTRSKIVTLCK